TVHPAPAWPPRSCIAPSTDAPPHLQERPADRRASSRTCAQWHPTPDATGTNHQDVALLTPNDERWLQLRCSFKSDLRKRGVFRIQLAQNCVSIVAYRHQSRSSCATERVQHSAACGAPSQYARLDQVGREGGEVCSLEGLGGDSPDAATVSRVAAGED